MLLLLVASLGRVGASGPDSAVPGRMALPWGCGEAHRVTWDPPGHWSHRKATGVAYDFSVREGTSLYSPTDGMAYFLLDERPYDTNLGNYVEIVSTSGDWLVRLAHLRDPQSGERWVKAGDPIGHSGSSGVPMEHLHLELLVRSGTTWARPDLSLLQRFFGLPLADYVEGAIIANDGCAGRLVLDGRVTHSVDELPLGDLVEWHVPLRNEGLEAVRLDLVQLLLDSPWGDSQVAQVRGAWSLAGKSTSRISVPFHPDVPGDWRLRRVTYQSGDAASTQDAEGVLRVSPSHLILLSATASPERLRVGGKFGVRARVKNGGPKAVTLDGLQVRGVDPRGIEWRASNPKALTLDPGESRDLLLQSVTIPYTVGQWRGTRFGYERDGQTLYFAGSDLSFDVIGPELRADWVKAYAVSAGLSIFMKMSNVGTEAVTPERLEVWGWRSGGEESFSSAHNRVTPLLPRGSALVQLQIPVEGTVRDWQLVQAGYWLNGRYVAIDFPEQPAIVMPSSPHGGLVP